MNLPPPTEKQARVIWLAITGLAMATLVALVVALIWGLGRVLNLLSPVLWPIAVAGVLAYLLDPVVGFLERRRMRRSHAIVCVFAAALLLIAGFVSSVVPQVVVETRQLVSRIPTYAANVQHRVEDWINNPPALVREYLQRRADSQTGTPAAASTNAEPQAATTNFPGTTPGDLAPAPLWAGLDRDALQSVSAWLADELPKAGYWLAGQVTKAASWLGVLVGLVLIPIYVFYFLLEKRGITSRWQDYLPVTDSKFKEELVFVLSAINDHLIVFFRGQVLVAICDGTLYTLGFIVIGLPYPVLLGVMATCLTMIPFIGAITTCVTALVIALASSGGWQQPLLVLAVFGVVQAMDATLISPKIMGDRVGLPPLAIIIALMVGTTLLGGLLGGLLAIPLAAALRVIMFRYVWKKREG